MKENLMKQFALTTIDKVQELKEAAKKAGLHLCVDMDLATESHHITLYERDADGKKLKTPSIFYKSGYSLEKNGCKKFAEYLQEAADFIANYHKESRENLEREVADLAEQLKAKKAALRLIKKEDTK